jgi:hypothetical protein
MPTVQTYAVVENGVVINAVLWDGNTENWQPPAGSTAHLLAADAIVSVGYTFDGTSYVAPAIAAS